jgi:dipeptidyl aminopeptidase/acylaminoacyl peptidase
VAADPATPPRLTEFPAGAGAAAESGRGWRPGGTGTHLAVPRPVEFATRDGATGYGLYYPPTNPDVTAPAGPPPLVVNCHGGPTGAVSSQYQADLQFFATRGLAVLDIDYAGSAGYGRDYRRRLAGAWGVRDVADCVDGARALAERGLADPDRLVIRGASAGGYTALAAVTFTDAFAAATSYYGISDLNALAQETHRFESHYAEGLLGGPPGHPAYRERSPLHHLDRLRRPVLLLHGSADTIVPANQARAIADRLNAIGVPHELVEFPGEGHGFRDAGTVSTALRTELAFYGRVLGFTPAEPLSPEAVAR